MEVVSKTLDHWYEKIALQIVQVLKIHPVYIMILHNEGYIANQLTILFLEVALRMFLCAAYSYIGTIGALLQVLWNSALDTDKLSASRSIHVSPSK
jgi:hypothetical protein